MSYSKILILLLLFLGGMIHAQTVVPHRDIQKVDSLNRGIAHSLQGADTTVIKAGYAIITRDDGRSYWTYLPAYLRDSVDLQYADSMDISNSLGSQQKIRILSGSTPLDSVYFTPNFPTTITSVYVDGDSLCVEFSYLFEGSLTFETVCADNVIGVGNDSIIPQADSLCFINLGDTTCVELDSIYYTETEVCFIDMGDTTCIDYSTSGGNIYTINGALTANRTVTLNNKYLQFIQAGGTGLYLTPLSSQALMALRTTLQSANAAILELNNTQLSGTEQNAFIRYAVNLLSKPVSVGIDASRGAFVWSDSLNMENPFARYHMAGDSLIFDKIVRYTIPQDWRWNSITSGTGLKLSSTSTGATGLTQKLFEVSLSGANANSAQSTYAGYFSNTHTGTTPINYAVYGTINAGGANTSAAIRGIAIDNHAGYFTSTSGNGVFGSSTSGTGVDAFSSTSNALSGRTLNGLALRLSDLSTSTNDVREMINIGRHSAGTAASGIGSSIAFWTETSTSASTANSIVSKWSDATHATRTSQLIFTGVDSTTTQDLLTLNGDGSAQFPEYGSGTFTGTETQLAGFDASGNLIEVDPADYGGGGAGDDWGSDVVNHDGTLTGDGTVGNPLGADTTIVATLYYVDSIAGATDHGALTGLTDDDHTQYALLAGRSSGQTLKGGTGTTDGLTLQTTSGVGTTGANMDFLVGNDGDVEAMTILNNGYVGLNGDPSTRLHLTATDGDIRMSDGVFENKGATTDLGIEFFKSGRMKSGVFTEVDNAILSYGINVPQIGDRNASFLGGIFRLDTRAAQNYFSVLRYPVGTAGPTGYIFDMSLDPNGNLILYNVASSTPSGNYKLHVKQSTTTTTPFQGIEQTSSGDASMLFGISGRSFAMGIDNSDSDLFKISTGNSSTNAVLGTSDLLTFTSAGVMTVTGDVNVPDEAYGAGWNGNLEVPTKNAVYDKIESQYTSTTLTLGASATTFARTGNVMTITGDGGGNTLATITAGISGQILNLIFVDANVSITDDGTATANTINLSAAFTSTAGDVMTLVFNGTSWYEVSRSIN